jgi:hypothetical protein
MPFSELRSVDALDVPLSDPALRLELRLLGDFMVAANRCTSPTMSTAEIDLVLHLVHPSTAHESTVADRPGLPDFEYEFLRPFDSRSAQVPGELPDFLLAHASSPLGTTAAKS